MADLPKGYKLDPNPQMGNGELPAGYKLDPYKDPITATSEKVAPVLGRTLVEALPAFGSAFGMPGILAGTALKTAAKVARPDLVGEPPQGISGGTEDMIKEVLLNNALPAGLGKLGGLATQVGMHGVGPTLATKLPFFPSVREGAVKQLSGSLKEQIGDSYQALGDYQPIRIQPNKAEFQPVEITPGQEFKPFRKGQPFQPQTEPTVAAKGPTKMVSSGGYDVIPGEVQKAKDRLTELITKDRIDAGKTLEELTGKNASLYADAMPTDVYQNSVNLLKTMKGLQSKGKMDMVLNYSGHKLLWSGAGLMTGGLTGAALGHPIAGLALGGTPIVLNAMLDKIMANPETAKLVTLAMTTPAKAPQATLINRALTEVLPRLFQAGADIAATPER